MQILKPLLFAVGVALLLPMLAAPCRAAERVALVIGNAAYRHAPVLRNPRNDAVDMARVLRTLSFRVIEGLDLDKSGFEAKLREFARAARGAEAALFFYAGHGLQVDGENYLLPVDSRLAEEVALKVEALELRAFLKQMRSPVNLVFLDACRNNLLAQGLARSMVTTRSAAVGRGLGRVDSASGTLIAYAAQPGNVAVDGKGRNSPFTRALLAHIATPDRSVNDLMAAVGNTVVSGSKGRQQPWTHSSLTLPFYFATSSKPADVTNSVRDDGKPVAVAPGGDGRRLTAEQLATERLFWESVMGSGDPADFQAYLDRYPQGTYTALATNRLKRLKGSPTQAVGTGPPSVPGAAVREPPPADPQSLQAAEKKADLTPGQKMLVQHGLSASGFSPGAADGVFGPRTRAMIGRWQVSRGKPATGYLDGTTARELSAKGEATLLPGERRRLPPAVEATLSEALRVAVTIDSTTDRTSTLAHAAETLAKTGDLSGAARFVAEALSSVRKIRHRVDRRWPLLAIAEARAAAGDIRGALATARGIADGYPRRSALWKIAKVQAEAGNVQGALATVKRIKDEKNWRLALQDLALARAEKGDFAEAASFNAEIAAIVRRIDDPAKRVDALSGLAEAWSTTSDAKAAASISDALSIVRMINDPGQRVEAQARIAEAQAKAGDSDGAARSISHALKLTRALEREASQLVTQHKLAKARAKEALAARNTIGWLRARGQANALLDRRLHLPDIKSLWSAIARAQAAAGQFGAALDAVEKMASKRSMRWSRYTILVAQAKAGDFAGGLATAERMESVDERAEALEALSGYQAKAGDIAGALATLRRIGKEDGKASALLAISRAQAKAGDFAAALATAQRLRMEGDKSWALYRISLAQAKAGDPAAGIATARRIVRAEAGARALADIAEVQAGAGDDSGAALSVGESLSLARRVAAARDRVRALVRVAVVQAAIGTE